MNGRVLWASLAIAAAMGACAAAFAPYLYAELWPWTHASSAVSNEPVSLTQGRMFDDYFAVQDLGAGTYAIGEPRYYQANYSYLIIGQRRALLFDAGSGTRNLRPVVAALTALPVTVLPSHLHFDHTNGIRAFDHIALVDLPETRARVDHGRFQPGRYEFLGMIDGLQAPSMLVSEWIKPGAGIDLGGRVITLLSTPGHTSQSVSLLDHDAHRLFTGDFIYPTMLYAFLPGSSLSAYRKTVGELLASLPKGTTLWTAHCCRRNDAYSAPWLSLKDLEDLRRALSQLDAGTLEGQGFFPRSYPVNDQMTLGTGFPWTNR
ncbi:MAG: MBL fold metallo-hydrolase [Steroidobacteraceae bacterium]